MADTLLDHRIIFLDSAIEANVASNIIEKLLLLEARDKNAPIYLYINSPGGVIYDGLAIYDTMRFIQPKIITVCLGIAASMASILLAAGDERYILPHGTVMIHQPLGGTRGQATDIKIYAEEILRLKDKLKQILVKHTGLPEDKVEELMDRDRYLSAEEAVELGIVDKIVEHRKAIKVTN